MGGGVISKKQGWIEGSVWKSFKLRQNGCSPLSTDDKQRASYHGGLRRGICTSLHCSLNFTTGHFMHRRGGHVSLLVFYYCICNCHHRCYSFNPCWFRFHDFICLACIAISRPSCSAIMLVTLKSNILFLSSVILEIWGKYWRHEVGQNKSWARREKKNSCCRDSTAPTGNLQLTFS